MKQPHLKNIILAAFFVSALFLPFTQLKAQVNVSDSKVQGNQNQALKNDKLSLREQLASSEYWSKTFKNMISNIYGQVLRTALTNLASDSAKWVASGGKGQSPLFHTDTFAGYLTQVGDSVLGQAIDSIAKQITIDTPMGKIGNFSFCNPNNFNVAVKIGLGLRSYTNGSINSSSCSFSKIRSNVESFVNDKRMVSVLQDMFEPTSNDIGLALTLQDKTAAWGGYAEKNAGDERKEGNGYKRSENTIGDSTSGFLGFNLGSTVDWKNNRQKGQESYDSAYNSCISSGGSPSSCQSVATDAQVNSLTNSAAQDSYDEAIKFGATQEEAQSYAEATANKYRDTPDATQKLLNQSQQTVGDRLLTSTGDALSDAANVFLNQLALQTFQNLMKTLGSTVSEGSSYKEDTEFWNSLTNKNAAPYNPGVKGAIAKNQILKQAQFSVRADFDILSELSICPNPQKAGPTECVIDEKFRQAVQDRKTVGEAIKDGTLPGDRIFGFQTAETEPKYNEGYPYRSMLILRKYRILPVGWETAAEHLHDHMSDDGGPLTLKDMVDCFSAEDDYIGYGDDNDFNHTWCRGMVDPNWLLKAPKNYCGKVGIGPNITNQTVGSDGELTVTRGSNYCADDQSCIKEKDDGSCELYGYCAEDKRIWNFGSAAKTCEPVYNTCSSFVNKETGKKVSYLKNTLDNSSCTSDVAGCQGYCTTAQENTTYRIDSNNQLTYLCSDTTAAPDRIFFDNGSKTCDPSNEGCRQLIRTKEGFGANLFVNAGFEENSNIDVAPTSIVGGLKALGSSLDTADGFNSTTSLVLKTGQTKITVPVGMQVYGWTFNLSFYSKGCSENDTFSFQGYTPAEYKFSASDWAFNSGSADIDYFGENKSIDINFKIVSNNCKIDAIKLERGSKSTGFSEYGASGVVHEKVLPNYLERTCRENPNQEVCKKFAAKCTEQEVGCDMFTSQTDNTQIPASVKAGDYCSAECVGFNDHVERETPFDQGGLKFFIPKTAKVCNAEASGCDEFTNLDKVGKGGEATEYYSYLRQCVKPEEGQNRCQGFYTWQSSGGQDYQLSAVQLYASVNGTQPEVTSNDQSQCNESIYNLTPSDPKYNPDCRQFYDKNGNVTYHLMSKTISCDNNCHPYRLTRLNSVSENEANCNAQQNILGQRSAYWDSAKEKCFSCANGGQMVNADTASEKYCVYQAVPEQGKTCQAQENGCREYVGSKGENIAQLFIDGFDGSDYAGWSGISGSVLTLSPESVRKGNSIDVSNGQFVVGKKIGSLLKPGKTYALSFIARSSNASPLNIYVNQSATAFSSATVVDPVATGLKVGDWQTFTLNVTASSTYDYTGEEILVFDGTASFNLDDIKLQEITDRYYFIKESWNTPDTCYNDVNGKAQSTELGLPYQIHCDHYKNRDNNDFYLRSFDSLCKESSVGCELMIDTHNSKDYKQTTKVGTNVITPADNFDYVVFDKDKQCASSQKGCERFGKQNIYSNSVNGNAASKIKYDDAWVINDPDLYDQSMCTAANLGCQEWTSDTQGAAYFKNPGNSICEYRNKKGTTDAAWLKQKMKYCGGKPANSLCSEDKDCSNMAAEGDKKCLEETDDQACPIATDKTFGPGSVEILQPKSENDINWVGLCPEEQSGCTEYIDPASKPSPNLVFNSSLDNLDNDSPATYADGWNKISGTIARQHVTLDKYTVYVIGLKTNQPVGTAQAATLSCGLNLSGLNNKLTSNVSVDLKTSVALFSENNQVFRTGSNGSCDLTLEGGAYFSGVSNIEVMLRKSVIDYKIENSLDKKSCNGEVNFSNGCVLFNERAANISGDGTVKYSELKFDADQNYSKSKSAALASTDSTPNNSNTIIKVDPDRKCNKWLTCSSKVNYIDNGGVEKSYCTDLAMCDLLKKDGGCDHVLKEDHSVPLPYDERFLNFTSYSKIGIAGSNDIQKSSFYSIDAMTTAGDSMKVPNGDFEISGIRTEKSGTKEVTVFKPSGWEPADGKVWNSTFFSVVKDSVSAQKEGVRYPLSGRGFLKLGAGYAVKSDLMHLSGSNNYLTFWINTKNVNQDTFVTIGTQPAEKFAAGKDWTMGKIKITNGGSQYIKLDARGIGRVYFDDFKIKPILNITDLSSRAPQCRLFAAEDSLACDYQEESGLNVKGLYGYCLEFDRAPGDPNACLMWWPVDRIPGDGISDEGVGYQGPNPLYYCAEADALIPVKSMAKSVTISGTAFDTSCASNCYSNPRCGYENVQSSGSTGSWSQTQTTTALTQADCTAQGGTFATSTNTCSVTINGSGNNARDLIEADMCPPGYTGTIWEISNDGGCGTGWGGNACADGGSFTWGSGGLAIPAYPWDGGKQEAHCGAKCEANGVKVIDDTDPGLIGGTGSSTLAWYEYDGTLMGNLSLDGANVFVTSTTTPDRQLFSQPLVFPKQEFKFYDPATKTLFDDRMAYCRKIVRTVTESGDNKFWSSRVYPNSTSTISGLGFKYDTVNSPFGAVVAPETFDPVNWDGDPTPGNGVQPILMKPFVNPEDRKTVINAMSYNLNPMSAAGVVLQAYLDKIGYCSNSFNACVVNAGPALLPSQYNCSNNETCISYSLGNGISRIKEIFAASYGTWNWISNKYSLAPSTDASDNWLLTGPPIPTVKNVSVNGKCPADSCPQGDFIIHKSGFVELVFNSSVDPNHRPLVAISIDWRNGDVDNISGVQLTDRSDPDNPHKSSHMFDYWTLKAKSASYPGVTCSDAENGCPGAGCDIKPSVKVKDNWDNWSQPVESSQNVVVCAKKD